MKRGTKFWCLYGAGLIILSLLFNSCSSVKNKVWEEEEIINPKFEHQIHDADKYLESAGFQGAVLVAEKGKIIFAKGYGLTDRKDKNAPLNTIHTTFEAGSITKQMTAAAIMQLAEKKKISVNDKISLYFPDFPYGDEITIRMLLTMRSGLTDCINATSEFFPAEVAYRINRAQILNKPIDRNIVLEYLNQAPLFSKPNSTFFYCNTDYYLLAQIIEQVSGKTYEDYINENIFKKCGMTYSNTEFQNTDTKGYDFSGRYYSIPASLALGCGNVNSNVIDLYKWNQQFTHGKVVSKKSFKEMINTESYGYGIYRTNNTILHGGNTNVFNSYNSYDLKKEILVIVLVNRPINEINSTIIAGKLKECFKY